VRRVRGGAPIAVTLDAVSSVPTARQRPVAVPDDLDDSAPIDGIVRLPQAIRWSGEPIDYDLANPRHLRSVYEQVLREGTEDDVRRYVRASTLVALWDDLFLPAYVQAAWAPWLRRHRVSQP